MATVRLRSLEVPLTGNSRSFNRAAKQAAENTRRLQRRQYALRREMMRLKAAARAAVAPLAALAGVAGAVKLNQFLVNTAKSVGELKNFADQAGLTTDTLQALQRAGGDWNIEAAQINQAMTRFTRVIGEADQGLMTYKRIFDTLGISLRDTSGELRGTEEVFEEFAQRLQGVGSSAERNTLLMNAFGRQGARLGLLFDRVGREGLDSFNESQKQLGILTEAQVQRQQELNRAVNSFGDVLTYQGRSLASAVSNEWTDMINSMAEAAPAIANLLEPALRGIVAIAAGVVKGIASIATGLEDILVRIGWLHDADDRFSRIREASTDLQRAIDRGARGAGAVPSLANDLVTELIDLRRDGIEIPVGLIPESLRESPQVKAAMDRYWREVRDTAVMNTEEANRAILKAAAAREKAELDIAEATARREAQMMADIRARGALRPGMDTDAAIRAEFETRARIAAQVERQNEQRRRSMFTPYQSIVRGEELRQENLADFDFTSRGDAVLNAERSRRQAAGAGLTEAMRLAVEKAQAAENAIIQLSDTTKNRLEPVFADLDGQLNNFFQSILDGTASASDAFKNLASEIAKAVFQALVLQPLVDSITGGVGRVFGFPTPAGAAQGGNVNAYQPRLVGELGTELFIPDTGGRIVPNRDLRGGVVNNFNFNIESTDGPGVQRALDRAYPVFVQGALDAQQEAQDRPGDLYE